MALCQLDSMMSSTSRTSDDAGALSSRSKPRTEGMLARAEKKTRPAPPAPVRGHTTWDKGGTALTCSVRKLTNCSRRWAWGDLISIAESKVSWALGLAAEQRFQFPAAALWDRGATSAGHVRPGRRCAWKLPEGVIPVCRWSRSVLAISRSEFLPRPLIAN